MKVNYIGRLKADDTQGVYVYIHFAEAAGKHRLSISGDVGRDRSQYRSQYGQINLSFRASDIEPAERLDGQTIERLFDIWDSWHLNDVQAGCKHQRAFAEACGVKPHVLWDTANGKRPTWTAEGAYGKVLTHETPVVCPICGYSYGSAWLYEEVPADVIDFLHEHFKVESAGVAA